MAKDTEVLAVRLPREEARKARFLAGLRGGWTQDVLKEGIRKVLSEIPEEQQSQIEHLAEQEGLRNATP